MSQPNGNWIVLAIAAAVLAACTTNKEKPVEPNLFPTGYKKEILATMTGLLPDPRNVRDAYISDPVLTPVDKDQRYSVCVRYNARDANRRYTGSTDRIGYFYAGHLNQLIAASNGQCANAAYKPFPELEKLCQATKCE